MADPRDRESLSSFDKDLEKTTHIESVPRSKYANLGLTAEESDFYEEFQGSTKHKALLRKIDWRLLPILMLLYLAAYLDRANIGNARIEGMEEDLGLSGFQYNIAVSLFFIPYILGEVPSNILLKRFKRPSWYLGTLTILWGIVMTSTGAVTNFGQLVACRVLLGLFECGFFPGAIYLITRWYTARELQFRIATLYLASAFSGAFSGLLAAGIAQMRGLGGLGGWAWIFIIEGLATIVLGIVCVFCLPDSPAQSGRWTSPEERKFMEIQAVIKDGGRLSAEERDKFRWGLLWELVTDVKVWMQAFILFSMGAVTYSFKFTMPSITQSMGYEATQAQLLLTNPLSVPPYIAGAIASVGLAWLSDRYQWRLPFIFGPSAVIVAGFAILIALAPSITNNVAACYIALVLVCMGQYPCNPASYAWTGSNLAGDSKRAVGMALHISLGNCGGILGSYMFLSRESPGYPTGFGIGLGLCAATCAVAIVLEYAYKSINKARDAMTEEEIHAQYTNEQLWKMGNMSPLFRYKL